MSPNTRNPATAMPDGALEIDLAGELIDFESSKSATEIQGTPRLLRYSVAADLLVVEAAYG